MKMPARTSASPSPPSTAPIASTPGPRATALSKIFTSALQSTLKTHSYENFATCFPTPAQACPTALEGVWKQLNEKLETNCIREFEEICKERNVIEGLNGWDKAIEDARRRRDRSIISDGPGRPLHTLTADELQTAHLTTYLQTAEQELEAKLKSTHQENGNMMQGVVAQRAEIEKLVAGLEAVVKDLEDSVEAMGAGMGKGVDGLRAEIWEMEEEIKAIS